ncbi:MAG: glucosamine-6-phosphate deaminase [Mycoplasmataceae bacterium]|nr:glucosamine-6-phosphate deaminase [Mycoplasmataceae bacterium]
MLISGKKKRLVKEIVGLISNEICANPKAILCLPTGSSPLPIYERIINLQQKNKISLSEITTYNLDEYLDLGDDVNNLSFRFFMNQNLFTQVDIDLKNTYFPDTVAKFNKKLDGVDAFALTLIGVGSNGHIAFNEPGSPFGRTQIVDLTKSTINDNFLKYDLKQYPTKAITMGLKDIFDKSKTVILIAWGESKREAINQFIKAKESGVIDLQWPITHFINHPNFTIYTDLKFKC